MVVTLPVNELRRIGQGLVHRYMGIFILGSLYEGSYCFGSILGALDFPETPT